MNHPPSRRATRVPVALAVTIALILGALGGSGPARAADLATDGQPMAFASDDLVPVLDSPIGQGVDLPAGVGVILPVGPDAAAHSALVRLSVFDAVAATVLNAAGAPALSIEAGHSGSTAILVPVTDGAFTIESSATAAARVEVLATFSGAPSTAGSTMALAAATNRPGGGDTLPAGPDAPATFGLLGKGGVPAVGVRAVHLSLTVVADAATVLDIAGQLLPVEGGTSTLSTVVTPTVLGDVEVRAGAPVDLRLDVRGWVAEAAPYAETLNGPGAYWPQAMAWPTRHDVSDAAIMPLELAAPADASHVLLLVWAAPVEHLATLDVAVERAGRARGALLDPRTGAQPQLAVVPVTGPVIMLSSGATRATVLVLGAIVGAQTSASAVAASITVDSPTSGDLDLVDNATFTFEGGIDAGDTTPLRIEVTRDGQPHGAANIVSTSHGIEWRFTTGVQRSGSHRYGFELVGRDGSRTSTQWSGTITVPGPEDLILMEGVAILGDEGVDATVLDTADGHVDFAAEPGLLPGQVFVGGITAGSPEGLIRGVVAVDDRGDRWRVTTTAATFEDVFLQVDRTAWQPVVQPDAEEPGIEIVPAPPGTPDSHVATSAVNMPFLESDFAPLEHVGDMVATDNDFGNDQQPPVRDQRVGAGARADASVAAGLAPMVAPVPKLEPLEPRGPSAPRPEESVPVEGNSGLSQGFGYDFEDKGSADGLSYRMRLRGEVDVNFQFVVGLQIGVFWTDWTGVIPPLPYPIVQRFEIFLRTQAKATVRGTIEAGGLWKTFYEAKLASISFAPTTLFIGPIPVVVTFNAAMKLKASAALGALMHLGFVSSTQAELRHGFRYRDGHGASLINEATTSYSDPVMDEDAVFDGAIVVAAGPHFSVGLKLYDMVGPTIGFDLLPALGMEVALTDTGPKVSFEIFVFGNVLVTIYVSIPAINFEFSQLPLIDAPFRWSLAKWVRDYRDVFPSGPDPTPDPDPDPTPGPDPTPPSVPDALAFAQQIDVRSCCQPDDVDDEGYSNDEPVELAGAHWVEGPPHPDAVGMVTGDFTAEHHYDGQLTAGSYPVISTGNRDFFNKGQMPTKVGSPRGSDVANATTLRLDVVRPPDVECVVIDYLFSVDGGTRGMFLAEWGDSTWRSDGRGNISAPQQPDPSGQLGPHLLLRRRDSDGHFSPLVSGTLPLRGDGAHDHRRSTARWWELALPDGGCSRTG